MLFHQVWDKRRGASKKYFHRAAFNLAALFLIVFIITAPFESAFAQSTDASATASSDSATSGTPALSSDQSNSNNSTATPSTTGSPQIPASAPTSESTPTVGSSAPSQISPNTVTPPTTSSNQPANPSTQSNTAPNPTRPPGAPPPPPSGGQNYPTPQPVAYTSFDQNHLTIDKNTGALATTYPITIPPGRNGLQPNVDLVYNSQNSQQGSIFGEGWSISIPYIARLNINGVDNLYSASTTNYFSSSLDGELATTTVSSSYIARTENGTFNKYTFLSTSNQWTMTDKNGTQYTFGSTADSQQNDPNNASDTFKWMLKQVTDTNNNTVVYSYFKDSGQIYPSSTLYTGNGSSTGIFEVDFLRTSSTDNASSSATGFGVNSNYRISEIDAKVNGTWVRKYALAYTTGDNASTTLLSSITESGQNSSGTLVSLPAASFSYQTQTSGWTASSTWNPPASFLNTFTGKNNGVRIADVNGDGLPDILVSSDYNGSSTADTAYINTGQGWVVSSTWAPPVSFLNTFNGQDNGVRIADVNGDGLPDILQSSDYNGSSTGDTAYINNGHGWTVSSTWAPPISFLTQYAGEDNGVRIVDVNGDGLPDILQGTTSSGSTTYAAYINNGHGWTSNSLWLPPVPFLDVLTGEDNGVRIVDVNGDGLPDILQNTDINGSTTADAAYINNGHGWTSNSSWDSPLSFLNQQGGQDNGVNIADVNGDGLPDILQGTDFNGSSTADTAYINNGHGWTLNSAWDPPISFRNTYPGQDNGSRIADVNGDGLPDLLQSSDYNGSSTADIAYLNKNENRADVLVGVTYAKGGSSTITYESASQYLGTSGNVLNQEPYPVYVVSKITNNDGSGNLSSLSYQYSGGTYYYNGPYDKQFAGFNVVTMTDSAENVTKTYYHTGNGSDSADGEYSDNFWKIGKPYRIENYDNGGHLYKVVVNKWDSYGLGSNAAFVFPDQTLEMDYDGLSTHSDKAESYTWNNANGNQTQKTQWGQVTGSTNGTFTDTGSDELITNLSYASSTSSNVIGKVSDEILTNQSSTKIQETQYYYDGLALGSVGVGNLTKKADWIASSTYATTQNTYNGYGLVTKSLDPRNNTTTYSYDAYNLYPATTTNALSQSTNNQYDYSIGKPTQTIDPNGDIFQTAYDGLGRPLQVIQPDPITSSTLETKTAYTYTDTANAVSVAESDYLNATTTVGTYSYYDGLGRLIQTRKSAEDSGIYKETDLAYNNVNLLQTESLPYFSSGSSKATATTTAALFTTYAYDPLGRTLTVGNAVGTTTNAYSNWEVTTTDPRGKSKNYFDDAYSNLIQVNEHNGSSTYSTYYTYDGLQDLTNITDALGNVRNFTYDGLGRRLTAQDLHAPADATYGTWNYTYDNAGNLTQTLDPKSQTVNYTYDALNRASTEDYTGQSGTEFTDTYDSCTQGVGRLCVVSSTADLVNNTYNPLGQIAQQTETIASSSFSTSYTYDRQNNQLTITNPDNSQIEYTYGTAGLVAEVLQKPSGGSFSPVVNTFDYSPTDQPATIDYSNGVNATNTYNPAQLYRLTQKLSTLPSGGGNAQNISYTYDADGNITQIADSSNSGAGRTVNYTYDDLSRLTVASTTNVSTTPSYVQNFSYDALGNILTGPAGNYSYGATTSSLYADPDAVTSIAFGITTTTPVTFDASSSINPSVASTTFTFSHTVGSGTNRALVLGVTALSSANTSTGASYNGVAMTQIGDLVYPGGIERLTLWYLANPASGTHTVSTTVAVASANVIPAAVSFTNVSGLGQVATSTASGATSSISITSSKGNMIADFVTFAETSTPATPTVRSGQTLLMAALTSGSARAGGMAYVAATSSATITNKWNDAGQPDNVAGDVELIAATSTATSTTPYNYDNNGNLVSSPNATNTWNYRNQLIQSVNGAGTSTYAYDYLGQRVQVVNGTTTTYYPETTYNTNGTTTIKHVFANGMLLATIQTTPTSTSPIAFDASSSINPSVASTTFTFSHTVGSGANRALILGITALASANTSTGASYNGVAMTQIGDLVYPGGIERLTLWYLANPASGTHTVSTTVTTASANIIPAAVSFANVLGLGQVVTSTASGATSSISITSAKGNMIADFVSFAETSTTAIPSPKSGQTLLMASTTSGLARAGGMAYIAATTSATMINKWNASGQPDNVAGDVELIGASTSTIINYVLNDNLGGTNVITNASGTAVVETLDYYPYGSARLDNTVGSYSGEARKYIGQMYDSATNLNYLNSRYQDPTRGQFLSEDPVFLAIGNPNQLQQLGEQDLSNLLTNPQSLNSYGYANDNPIVNKDPTGRYLEISASLVIPGRSFSAGIQIDQYGIVGFFGGGLGYGGGGGLEVAWAPGQSVPHQRNAAISVSGEYADVFGGRVSQNISQYSPDSGGSIPVGGPSYAFVFGAGGGIGIQQQLSAPLPYLTWGHPPTVDSQQQTGQPQSINDLPKTYLSQGSSQSSYGGSQSSNSGGSSGKILSSLSNIISQLSTIISSIGRK